MCQVEAPKLLNLLICGNMLQKKEHLDCFMQPGKLPFSTITWPPSLPEEKNYFYESHFSPLCEASASLVTRRTFSPWPQYLTGPAPGPLLEKSSSAESHRALWSEGMWVVRLEGSPGWDMRERSRSAMETRVGGSSGHCLPGVKVNRSPSVVRL